MANSAQSWHWPYHTIHNDTRPFMELVRDVLRSNFAAPYPEDITDQLCLAIEAGPNWLRRYETLVEDFNRHSQHGRDIVNNSIGY